MARSIPASALVLVLLLLAACGGGSSSPPPSPVSPTPSSNAIATPTTPAPSTTYLFVYREFGREQDTIWRVVPSDPSQRERLAVIPHRADWGVIPSLSPDGKLLAYLTMPERAFDTSSQAEAYILDLKSGKTNRIAAEVDLLLPPLWSPDGNLLFLRRDTGLDVMILQVDLAKSEKDPDHITTVLEANTGDLQSAIPIGFAGDGRSLYLIQIQGNGDTVLATLALSGSIKSQTTVLRLAQGRGTRDYDLSPDSKRLTFLAQELVGGRLLFRAFVADLVGRSVTPLSTEGLSTGDHLRPLWRPDGARIALGQTPSAGRPGAVALVPPDGGAPSFLPPPTSGFDLPQSWAPDGSYLAVTSQEGDNPGKTWLVLVAPTGRRVTVGQGVDAVVVGWMKQE